MCPQCGLLACTSQPTPGARPLRHRDEKTLYVPPRGARAIGLYAGGEFWPVLGQGIPRSGARGIVEEARAARPRVEQYSGPRLVAIHEERVELPPVRHQ